MTFSTQGFGGVGPVVTPPQALPSAFAPLGAYNFDSLQLDFTTAADWAVAATAAQAADSNNAALTVRRFDSTNEEGVGFLVFVPAAAATMAIQLVSRAETAPGAADNVVVKLYRRQIPDNSAVPAWSAATTLSGGVDIPTNENWQYDTFSNPLATWGVTAGLLYQFELTRDDGGTGLAGDWTLLNIGLTFT